MRRLTSLVAVMALVAALGWRTDAVVVAERLLAPVYDAVTVSSIRNLATALHSRAIAEGTLEGVTVAELHAWGWEPAGTTAVVIWVDGDRFRAEATDVRPGASTFAVGELDAPTLGRIADPPQEDLDPGVQIIPADL